MIFSFRNYEHRDSSISHPLLAPFGVAFVFHLGSFSVLPHENETCGLLHVDPGLIEHLCALGGFVPLPQNLDSEELQKQGRDTSAGRYGWRMAEKATCCLPLLF